MKRFTTEPRPNWRHKVEQQGLLFHSDDAEYWTDRAYYSFTEEEIVELESASNELHRICLEACQSIIDRKLYGVMRIPPEAIPWVEWSWEAEPPTIYGRFDLAFGSGGPPKLLEYNADTPTSLLEAAVIQWKWIEDVFPNNDQFNSIYEGLVDVWRWYREHRQLRGIQLHFAHCDTVEDFMTVTLLRDTAHEAGLATHGILVEHIGYDEAARYFVDDLNHRIWSIFKLYPWEWMLRDPFAPEVLSNYRDTQWIEPIWKMLLSNKAILPILWDLFPNHPNLLPAYFEPDRLSYFARKPIFGREGANVTLNQPGQTVSTEGDYGEEGFVYQKLADLPNFAGNVPVIGSWMISGECRGVGIRETDGPITDNLARFVPHIIE